VGGEATHIVGSHGAAAWRSPDGSAAAPRLDPGLPVTVLERRGDWAQVRCSNGWTTWTDGRALVPVSSAGSAGVSASGSGRVAGGPRAVARDRALLFGGAAAAFVGSILPWFSAGGVRVDGWDLQAWSLIANRSADAGGPAAGLLVALAALAALAVVIEVPAAVVVALGALATNPAAFALARWIQADAGRPTLGIGAPLALAGGLAIGAAGWFRLQPQVVGR
jgi:hypothetical protein